MLLHPGLACDCGEAPGQDQPEVTRTGEEAPLTAEEAKAALVRMTEALQPDEASQTDTDLDLPESALRDLKGAKTTSVGEGVVAFESWKCDLAKKTWTFETHDFHFEGGLSTLETSVCRRFCGVFSRRPAVAAQGATGQWEAMATSVVLEETTSETRSIAERERLTAEEARAALVRMVEQPDGAYGDQPALKSAKTEVIGEDQVAFGPMWTCDLRKKLWAFDVAFSGGEGDPSSFQHFVGVFYRDATGQWQATTTGGMYVD